MKNQTNKTDHNTVATIFKRANRWKVHILPMILCYLNQIHQTPLRILNVLNDPGSDLIHIHNTFTKSSDRKEDGDSNMSGSSIKERKVNKDMTLIAGNINLTPNYMMNSDLSRSIRRLAASQTQHVRFQIDCRRN